MYVRCNLDKLSQDQIKLHSPDDPALLLLLLLLCVCERQSGRAISRSDTILIKMHSYDDPVLLVLPSSYFVYVSCNLDKLSQNQSRRAGETSIRLWDNWKVR